jgi:hypothetical protein
MNRRTLLKFLALLPVVGPTMAKAFTRPSPKPALACGPYIPAFFPKWNETTDGLEDAGRWSLAVQRSFLPRDIRFPKVGQVWAAVRDCPVGFRARIDFRGEQDEAERLLKAFGGRFLLADRHLVVFPGIGQLREGERVRILSLDDADKPLQIGFQPVRCQDLEANIVPEEVRNTPGYIDYELSLKTAKTAADFAKDECPTYFNEAFRLVEDTE